MVDIYLIQSLFGIGGIVLLIYGAESESTPKQVVSIGIALMLILFAVID